MSSSIGTKIVERIEAGRVSRGHLPFTPEGRKKMAEKLNISKAARNSAKNNGDLLGLGNAATPSPAHARSHTLKKGKMARHHLPHLSHVADYVVVSSAAGSEDFRSKVREMLAMGYHLQGGVAVSGHTLLQALTKESSLANDLLKNNVGELLNFGAAAGNK